MTVAIRDIRKIIALRFPDSAAENWDNPGLQLGRGDTHVRRVLVALELTPAVTEEAISWGAGLIVTHHPFIFKPFRALNDDSPEGRMLLDLAENKIGLIAAHTNLDAAPDCIAQKLARDLDLKNCVPFIPHNPYLAYKIVVFVPDGRVDGVAQAMHEEGAGCIGKYREVSFRSHGTGHFTCGADTHPAIGSPGSSETVDETRIEMVVSGRDLKNVTRAMLKAHPYEEPAYDVFRLESGVTGLTDMYGFGVQGELRAPMTLRALLQNVKQKWTIPSLRAAGHPEKIVSKIAILNGSGAKFLDRCRNIDALITGDCGHHDFDNAVRRDIALIDAGHYDTEKFIPEILAQTVAESTYGPELEIRIARTMANPFSVY